MVVIARPPRARAREDKPVKPAGCNIPPCAELTSNPTSRPMPMITITRRFRERPASHHAANGARSGTRRPSGDGHGRERQTGDNSFPSPARRFILSESNTQDACPMVECYCCERGEVLKMNRRPNPISATEATVNVKSGSGAGVNVRTRLAFSARSSEFENVSSSEYRT